MHIYIFGSVCRGEVEKNSDVDMLACINDSDDDYEKFDTETYSVYKYSRLQEMWYEGNPFAWHLYKDSILVYSSNGKDFIKELGLPGKYLSVKKDIKKFVDLYYSSLKALKEEQQSRVFNLSCIFLAVRNCATCYALSQGELIFSRDSSKIISEPLLIDDTTYSTLLRARILTTRGYGDVISSADIKYVMQQIDLISVWIDNLWEKVNNE